MRQFVNVKAMLNNDLRFHVNGYSIKTDTTGSAYMRRESTEQYNVRRARVIVSGRWKPT